MYSFLAATAKGRSMALEISVVLITRDAERTVGRTLESVSGLAAETIVVDSGSADRTVEICRNAGARVFEREWPGYGAQKNFAIQQAGCPWVLSLDADESLSPELAAEIAALDENLPCRGYRIPRLNYYFGRPLRHGGQFPDYQLRLFRRGSGRFDNRPVHESVAVEGPVGELSGVIEHRSYLSLDDYLEKFLRYTDLEAERLLASGIRPTPSLLARRMVLRPAWKFLWRYLFKAGFRDGVPGLLAALFNSITMIVSHARFWEKYRARSSGA